MKVRQVVLVCDTCGGETDVETHRLPMLRLRGEACAGCWKAIEESVAHVTEATAKWRSSPSRKTS
jgi:hypothetical protein